LSLPFLVRDQEIYVSVSIGIVSSETGYTRADQVLRAADLAMYRAKRSARTATKFTFRACTAARSVV